MGAESSLHISRRAAILKIQSELQNATDEDLAEILYEIWGRNYLYNFSVGGESFDDQKLFVDDDIDIF